MSLRRTIIGLTFGFVLLFSQTASAAEDVSCLQKAIDRRQTDLKDTYMEYSKMMTDAVTRLTADEKSALGQTDSGYRQNSTSAALSNFRYAVDSNWQQLSARLFQIWSGYYRERYQCGFAQVAPPAYGGYNNNANYGVRTYCTQPVLQAPPAGCNFECARDSNGCDRCHLACRTPVSYSACGCPPLLSPVCSRDNRTYDNACLASCDGRTIWHIGVCQ